MKPRRYIAVIQDHRGYPGPGEPLEPAPPEGVGEPTLISVVKADDHEAEVKRLRGLIADLCDPKPGCWQRALSAGREEVGRDA